MTYRLLAGLLDDEKHVKLARIDGRPQGPAQGQAALAACRGSDFADDQPAREVFAIFPSHYQIAPAKIRILQWQ